MVLAPNSIQKPTTMMKEPNQIKNSHESKRMSPKLSKNDTVRSEPMTFDDAPQEQSLNPLNQVPIRAKKRRAPNHRSIKNIWPHKSI